MIDTTDSKKQLRRVALNLLARREHSAKELLQKLQQRGFAEIDIQHLLTRLTEENLLNPARFIESFIHARSAKGIGPLRIQAELTERGLPQELIEHYLDITDNAWLIKAWEVWKKRFKNQRPIDFKTRAQQMRFLHYRGFSVEQIATVLED